MRFSLPRLLLVVCFLMLKSESLRANGGAWQVGVASTGNGTATDKRRSTEVAIEEESLTIDLHQEFAAIEVRYRMRNTGPKVLQDFFFPVERWSPSDDDADGEGGKPADLENYRITADNAELKVKTIDLPVAKKPSATPEPEPEPEPAASPSEAETPAAESTESSDAEAAEQENPGWTDDDLARVMEDFAPATRHWKKSEIPFAANQTREVMIRYRVRYSGYERSVSDDTHASDQVLAYSLSPAATWKGPIVRGKVVVNVLHPLPEEVAIEKPKDRFRKVSDTHYEWEFRDLEPTLDDDLKIIAHRAYHSYHAGNAGTEDGEPVSRDYVIQGDRYYLRHADFEPVASSTLSNSGERSYSIKNITNYDNDLPWCEGAPGDGINESITLDVTRPLPLDSIEIVPGYHSFGKRVLWEKNNRVAELEVTLNGTKTFSVKIPDEHYAQPYPIPVRDYTEPVRSVKLVIKAVHRGTAARDTCISDVRLKAKLAEKPKIQPAR